MLGEVFSKEAQGERAVTVRSFLLHQLRLFADASMAPRLAPLLRDGVPLVLDAVTAVMVSMGEGARPALQEAIKGAEGHAKVAIEHALHQIQ